MRVCVCACACVCVCVCVYVCVCLLVQVIGVIKKATGVIHLQEARFPFFTVPQTQTSVYLFC
jgi:hypothetical protein